MIPGVCDQALLAHTALFLMVSGTIHTLAAPDN